MSQISDSDLVIRLRCTGTFVASMVTILVKVKVINSRKQRLHRMLRDVILVRII